MEMPPAPMPVMPQECFTLTIASGKGGVGKTQLSANLALTLARQGRRVLLLDGDWGLAGLDLALNVKPERTLRDVLSGAATLEEIMVRTPGGVYLLPGSPGRYDMANLDRQSCEELMQKVEALSAGFDVLLVDTAAGLGAQTVTLAASGEVLLVATPELHALRDVYALAKVLHTRFDVQRMSLVVNQVTSASEGYALYTQLQQIIENFLPLKLSYAGALPLSPDIARSSVTGEPYALHAPASASARAVEALVGKLLPPMVAQKDLS